MSTDLAQIAYEAYADVGSALEWRPVKWDALTEIQKDAWQAAAQAVKDTVLDLPLLFR